MIEWKRITGTHDGTIKPNKKHDNWILAIKLKGDKKY